jgi:hypothetical protein
MGTSAKPKPAEQADAPTPEPEAAPVEEPSGSELVVRDIGDRQEFVTVVDRHDEAMIVQELQRRTLKVMLYSFRQDGHTIVDLSYLGVNEAVRVMNDSRKWEVTIDPGSLVVESVMEDLGDGEEPCWTATVYAVNRITSYGQYGTFTQPKRIHLSDARKIAKRREKKEEPHDSVADKFARQKAINKAQRNALRVHIPETMRQTIIAQYQGDPERIKRIEVGAGAEAMADLPPPLVDEKAEAQKAQARELFDSIREIGPLILLPAVFHKYLRDAEHSHERLEDFLGYLRDVLERAQKEQAKTTEEAK